MEWNSSRIDVAVILPNRSSLNVGLHIPETDTPRVLHPPSDPCVQKRPGGNKICKFVPNVLGIQ
ncbi:MAG TPA: hypothetical protein VMJ33_04160 [Gallionella sp.]|nr:hypothetical protein [Gallionella sp.]